MAAHMLQAAVCRLLTRTTVLVGHSLHYDLLSLRVRHPLVIGQYCFSLYAIVFIGSMIFFAPLLVFICRHLRACISPYNCFSQCLTGVSPYVASI